MLIRHSPSQISLPIPSERDPHDAQKWLKKSLQETTWELRKSKINYQFFTFRDASKEKLWTSILELRQEKEGIQNAQSLWQQATVGVSPPRAERLQQALDTTTVLERKKEYKRQAKVFNGGIQKLAQKLPSELRASLLTQWGFAYRTTLNSIEKISTPHEKGYIAYLKADFVEILKAYNTYKDTLWNHWEEFGTLPTRNLLQEFADAIARIFPTQIPPAGPLETDTKTSDTLFPETLPDFRRNLDSFHSFIQQKTDRLHAILDPLLNDWENYPSSYWKPHFEPLLRTIYKQVEEEIHSAANQDILRIPHEPAHRQKEIAVQLEQTLDHLQQACSQVETILKNYHIHRDLILRNSIDISPERSLEENLNLFDYCIDSEILDILQTYHHSETSAATTTPAATTTHAKNNLTRSHSAAAATTATTHDIPTDTGAATHPLDIWKNYRWWSDPPLFCLKIIISSAALGLFHKRHEEIQWKWDQLIRDLHDPPFLQENLTTDLNNLLAHSAQLIHQTFNGRANATWEQGLLLIERLETVWERYAHQIDGIIPDFYAAKRELLSSQNSLSQAEKQTVLASRSLNLARHIETYSEEAIDDTLALYSDPKLRPVPVSERL